MTTLLSIIIFILGSAIGSFLSVVIYRLNTRKKGIFLSRSICTSCNKRIKWQHIFPVFSWLFLRGKCAYCGAKISLHYLMLEILTGALFVLTFIHFNFLENIPSLINPEFLNYQVNWKIFEQFIFYTIQFSFLVGIFFYDLLHKQIPDELSLPAISLAIIGGLILGNPTIMEMLIGGTAIFTFFLLQFLLSKGTWVGGGDIRLGALMGLLLGWEKGLLALTIAYLVGGTFSIFLLAAKKIHRKSTIPFGPFLILGTIIVIFWGEKIVEWYFNNMLI